MRISKQMKPLCKAAHPTTSTSLSEGQSYGEAKRAVVAGRLGGEGEKPESRAMKTLCVVCTGGMCSHYKFVRMYNKKK